MQQLGRIRHPQGVATVLANREVLLREMNKPVPDKSVAEV
jgi:hypothetical protein